MSLINNMLKDLERRKERDHIVASVPIGGAYDSDMTTRQSKIMTAVIIASLSLTSIYVLRLLINKPHQATQQMQMNAPALSTPLVAPKPVDNNWLASVNITGITLQTKENITELTFMLSREALYEITTNGMQNQFAIIIEKSQLQSEIPPVRFLNTAIQSITSTQIDGNTRFNLTLNPNATIKYVNLSSDAKNPELTIAIEYHTAAAQEVQRSAAVKTPVMQSLLLQKYQIALDEAKIGRFQQAISGLSSLLEVDPSYQEARTTLAALLLDKGNAAQATKIINEGLNINPGYVPFVELKARLLSQDGKTQQALNLLQSVIPPMGENPNYHALVAALYARNNKDVLAIRTYQKLLSMDSHNGSWWFGLAVSYDKLGKSRDAASAYEHAMNEGHLNSDSLAYLQRRLESLQEAENDKA